ncbi:hypothetical protein J4219_06195 [Candidatus Woesearchaeota archaeon]|nr:hypothetical protein [Candidatus Woesearchaeota archaeon]
MAERTVFIAVHPHNAYGIYDRDAKYARRRDKRLSDLSLAHVVLVDQPNLPAEVHRPDIIATGSKLDLYSPYWSGRVFLTYGGKYASDYKSGGLLSLDNLSEVIRTRFPAESYVFWGAELHRPPADLESRDWAVKKIWEQRNEEPYGCMLFYFSVLDLPNKSIDKRHCFILDF